MHMLATCVKYAYTYSDMKKSIWHVSEVAVSGDLKSIFTVYQ